MTMRKVLALCCVLGILLLSACSPSKPQTDPTTTTESTTTTTTQTDDSAWGDTDWSDDFVSNPTDDPVVDDEPVVDEPVEDEEPGEDDNTDLVYEEILPEGNPAQLLNPQKGGADAEAEALRQQILNTKDNLTITGTTYYVSPNGDDFNDGLSPETAWETCDNITTNNYLLEPGDAVLFERGGIYRRTAPIVAKSGVTYGAYGEGDKPLIYGSSANYAWGENWEPSRRKYVWKTTMYTREAGIMVFNSGEGTGTPKYHGINELQENGDFYHNVEDGMLYLYLDKGYPNVVYNSIEIGTRENIFSIIEETHDVTFDNLALRYAGMFAFDINEYTESLRFTNLEIGWVGGCRYSTSETGLGNAIQFWENSTDGLVENCWIYQVYDAGISPQGTSGVNTYKDIVFRGNLIEFCNYSIEVFDRNTASKWDGLVVEDNIMRFAGYGFLLSSKRSDKGMAVAHYVGWSSNYDELPGKGIVIKNNIFDCSAENLVYWTGKTYDTGLEISGNSFYQKANKAHKAIHFAKNAAGFATNQAELEAAVKVFDSNPKVVKWVS